MKKIVYTNETSSSELSFFKFNGDIKKYVEKKQKNCHFHKGVINQKKITYYTNQ